MKGDSFFLHKKNKPVKIKRKDRMENQNELFDRSSDVCNRVFINKDW